MNNKNHLYSIFQKYLLIFILMTFFIYSLTYVAQRSFWIDESMVALAIVNSSLSPFEPSVQYNQVTPWGFLLITRLFQGLFGAGDMQFRLPGLLFYSFGMYLFSKHLKRRFGLCVTAAITVAIMANPLILHYSTEFKHYIYEFTFVLLILTNYLRMKEEKPGAFWIYGATILFSMFFGISTVFVIGAVFAFELLYSVRQSIKKFISSQWLFLHFVYGVLFLTWYVISITPNLRYNLMNYPHVYGVDLGPANITNLSHWAKVLINAILSILVPQSILFLITLSGLFINSKRERSSSDWAILVIPILVYLLIYAANFAGFYPILLDRHLLYTLPGFYLLFAYSLERFSTTFSFRLLQLAAPILLIVLALVTLGIHHAENRFRFQEIKQVLAEIEPDDDLFIYFTAQPGYEWYKFSRYPDLPDPLNPRVNSTSGPRIPIEEMVANLPDKIDEVGAWPTLALLTQIEDAYLYEEDYMGEMVAAHGDSILLISHRSGLQLRNYLKETCAVERKFGRRGASIYSVDCPEA